MNVPSRRYTREDLAIRTHDYILLSKDQERPVTEAMTGNFVDCEKHPEPPDVDGLFWRWETYRHEALRAMAKDYDESPAYCVASQVAQMYYDIEDLHKLGTLVRDVHAANYLGAGGTRRFQHVLDHVPHLHQHSRPQRSQ